MSIRTNTKRSLIAILAAMAASCGVTQPAHAKAYEVAPVYYKELVAIANLKAQPEDYRKKMSDRLATEYLSYGESAKNACQNVIGPILINADILPSVNGRSIVSNRFWENADLTLVKEGTKEKVELADVMKKCIDYTNATAPGILAAMEKEFQEEKAYKERREAERVTKKKAENEEYERQVNQKKEQRASDLDAYTKKLAGMTDFELNQTRRSGDEDMDRIRMEELNKRADQINALPPAEKKARLEAATGKKEPQQQAQEDNQASSVAKHAATAAAVIGVGLAIFKGLNK